MATNKKLKNRDLYLNKLIAFQDTEPIKIVTGVRRCGKSSLLKLMIEHLKNAGVSDNQIVEMNFESNDFHDMTSQSLYEYVKSRVIPHTRMYFFFDEVQRVDKWEDALNSFRVDFDCDIYVTGSNAYLLSSEYSTYLSGRCVEIKMLPLSFAEFLPFYDFELQEEAGILGEPRKTILDKSGKQYTPREVFDAYVRFGGMPGIGDVGLEQEQAMTLLDGIYSTVVVRDILEREKRKGQNQITDPALLRKIVLFLADNVGNNVSISSIGNTLANEGLLNGKNRKGNPSTHTVQAYIDALIDAYFYYEIKRFDIKGKEFLRTLGKYYIVDIGMRNYLLGLRDRDRGHVLENIVYLELLRRGFDVSVGKIGNCEIDFVATSTEQKIYAQVTESMLSSEVRKRELAPLKQVNDNYEKIVLSLDVGLESSFEGIKSLNVIDWLLESY